MAHPQSLSGNAHGGPDWSGFFRSVQDRSEKALAKKDGGQLCLVYNSDKGIQEISISNISADEGLFTPYGLSEIEVIIDYILV